jgi:LEA14-like dessication related protein
MTHDTKRTPVGRVRAAMLLLAALLLAACASMPARDPLQVTVAGIEPLTGEGMEIRLLVKLRVQNPNDTPVEFNGAALNLDVMGRRFASGVSDEAGTVPRFGEAIVAVPVTVSVLRMARQFMGMLDGKPVERINYSMSGKLHGAGMSGTKRFSAQGDFELPRSPPVAAGAT